MHVYVPSLVFPPGHLLDFKDGMDAAEPAPQNERGSVKSFESTTHISKRPVSGHVRWVRQGHDVFVWNAQFCCSVSSEVFVRKEEHAICGVQHVLDD